MLVVYYIATLILTTEMVMATTEQCGVYKFKSPFYPGESCEDIYNKNTESHERSGYYWITDGPSKVYCGLIDTVRTSFSTNETSYQRMCGGTQGYQKGPVNGFYSYSHSSQTIEGYYVERLSITYGHLLAGMNQYCESGGTEIHNSFAYYFDDPLWDRSNCIASYCCNTPNQPWFYTELSDATKNAIEAIEYVCGINMFRSGNSLVDQPELYIQ